MKIKVPRNIDGAKKMLTDLGGLVTAKEWERAAIVAAFVEMPGRGKSTSGLSTKAFAALGIAGLRSPMTVQRYVEAWDSLKVGRPVPGEEFSIDRLPEWPSAEDSYLDRGSTGRQRAEVIRDRAEAEGVGASKAVDIASNPKAMRAAILADPGTAIAARKALAEREREQAQEPVEIPDLAATWQTAEEARLHERMGNIAREFERAVAMREDPEGRVRLLEWFRPLVDRINAQYVVVPDDLSGLLP